MAIRRLINSIIQNNICFFPVLIFLLFVIFGVIDKANFFFFFFGYAWSFGLTSKKVENVVNKKNYRFSFLRACYLYNGLLKKMFNKITVTKKYNEIIGRATSLLFVVLILWMALQFPFYYLVISFLGFLICEVVLFTQFKVLMMKDAH